MNRWTALALLLLAPGVADGASITIDTGETDIIFATGGMTGTVESHENKAAGVANVGGVTFGVAAIFDLSAGWSGSALTQVALDSKTRDILRKGIGGVLLYHLFGGSKKLSHKLYNAEVTQSQNFSLALLMQGAYQGYSARDPSDKIKPIEGTVVEISGGLDFRKDLGTKFATGLQIASTVLSMPASVEGLRTKVSQAALYFRTYL